MRIDWRATACFCTFQDDLVDTQGSETQFCPWQSMQDWLSWQLTVWKSQRSAKHKISCAPFWDFRPVENSPKLTAAYSYSTYVYKASSDRWEFMTVHLVLPELSLHQPGTLISGWVSPTSLQTHLLNGNLPGFEPKSSFVLVNTIARICWNKIDCYFWLRLQNVWNKSQHDHV